MQLLSFFFLIASILYGGYLPFSATKVSGRRRKKKEGKCVIACSKESLCFNMIKSHDF